MLSLQLVINDMQDTRSQQAFHFYQHGDISYALSLSALSTDNNYKNLGLEIEELDSTETPEKFFNTTTNLARASWNFTTTRPLLLLTWVCLY